jgi:hypothetical protein
MSLPNHSSLSPLRGEPFRGCSVTLRQAKGTDLLAVRIWQRVEAEFPGIEIRLEDAAELARGVQPGLVMIPPDHVLSTIREINPGGELMPLAGGLILIHLRALIAECERSLTT